MKNKAKLECPALKNLGIILETPTKWTTLKTLAEFVGTPPTQANFLVPEFSSAANHLRTGLNATATANESKDTLLMRSGLVSPRSTLSIHNMITE